MPNTSLYYYNQKSGWTFLPTINLQNRMVMASALLSFDAIGIIQDTDPPFVRKVYPANGGNFHYKDVRTISVIADDYLSGISSDEQTMSMKLNGQPVRYAFQPLKKELYYYLPTPLNAGEHTVEYSLSDQAGNQVSGSTTFRVN